MKPGYLLRPLFVFKRGTNERPKLTYVPAHTLPEAILIFLDWTEQEDAPDLRSVEKVGSCLLRKESA